MDSKRRNLINIDLINVAQDVLISGLTTLLYGKETSVPEINILNLTDWFQSQKSIHPKIQYGVIYHRPDVTLEVFRIYQGMFDSKWECITARQVISSGISNDVKQLLENEDLIIFDTLRGKKPS